MFGRTKELRLMVGDGTAETPNECKRNPEIKLVALTTDHQGLNFHLLVKLKGRRRNLSKLLDWRRGGGEGQVFVSDLAERGRGQEEPGQEGKHGWIKRGGGGR